MHNELLSLALSRALEKLETGDEDGAWIDAERALRLARPDDPDMDDSDAAIAVELREADELRRVVHGWRDGSRDLPPSDKAILKRAMKAFRKRIKLERLDEESTLGGRGLTTGRHSGILGVRPPEQYPHEIWDELVRRGRLKSIGHGLYEATSAQD
jgi:hypothetical protein